MVRKISADRALSGNRRNAQFGQLSTCRAKTSSQNILNVHWAVVQGQHRSHFELETYGTATLPGPIARQPYPPLYSDIFTPAKGGGLLHSTLVLVRDAVRLAQHGVVPGPFVQPGPPG